MKSKISSVFSTFLQISRPQKKSQTYSNLYAWFVEIYWISGIFKWHCHQMPKACSSCVRKTNDFFRKRKKQVFLDKYLMHTFQASVRAKVNGRSKIVRLRSDGINVWEQKRSLVVRHAWFTNYLIKSWCKASTPTGGSAWNGIANKLFDSPSLMRCICLTSPCNLATNSGSFVFAAKTDRFSTHA